MTLYYDEKILRSRLSRMDRKSLVLFGLFMAERLFPNYSAFSKEQSWGDVRTLRLALDVAWAWLEGRQLDNNEIELRIGECESLAPDTEEFHSLYVSAALDAANAAANALRLQGQR
jgi:uncharacterized protein YjaG (DUF416 family)